MGVGQLVPITGECRQIEGVVHAPVRPGARRALDRGAVHRAWSQTVRQSRLLSKIAAQPGAKPRQPLGRRAQPLQQRHLRHVGDATGARLRHSLSQAAVVDGVEQQQAQQHGGIGDIPGATKRALLPGRVSPAGRKHGLEHFPLVVWDGLHAGEITADFAPRSTIRLTPMGARGACAWVSGGG